MAELSPIASDGLGSRASLCALAGYFAFSFVLFGRGLAGRWSSAIIGQGPDPYQHVWSFVWWPYAIESHLNPILCKILWVPLGINLAWSNVVPLAAIAAWPLTAWIGPIPSNNIVRIAAPAVAAWAGYLVCHLLSKSFWAALFGGFVFGFSAYFMGQEYGGHLALILAFPIPLLLWNFLRRLRGTMSAVRFIAAESILLAAQFLFSTELFATMSFFGAATLTIAFFLAPPALRASIKSQVPLIAASFGVTFLVLAPYLYYVFAFGLPAQSLNPVNVYSADLLNFVVPAPNTQIGDFGPLRALTDRFPGNLSESGAYVGIPLLLIVLAYARAHWHEFQCKLAVTMFVLTGIAALGPGLWIAGTQLMPMPWKLFVRLPLIKNALPARFAIYGLLDCAIVVSLWLAASPLGKAWKLAVAGIAAVSVFPNLNSAFFVAPIEVPSFYSEGTFRKYLRPGETVLQLPYAIRGNGVLCQAISGMYFRLASGFSSRKPEAYVAWPIIRAFLKEAMIPDAGEQLDAFMATHGVGAIVVEDSDRGRWQPMLSSFGGTPITTGGVAVYQIQPDRLAKYRAATALEFETKLARARFERLLGAAQEYLSRGGEVASLTPWKAQRMGLFPPDWVRDEPVHVQTNEWHFLKLREADPITAPEGLVLGPFQGEKIAVGVVSAFAAVKPLVTDYGRDAEAVYFPFPRRLTGAPGGDSSLRKFVMVFDRAGLARAAHRAQSKGNWDTVAPYKTSSLQFWAGWTEYLGVNRKYRQVVNYG